MTLSSAIRRNRARLEPRQQAVQMIDQQHHIRRLGRGRRAARAHRDADIGGREGRCVVHAVAHHHHRAVLALGQDQQHLLIGRQVRPDARRDPALRSRFPPRRGGRRSQAGCALTPSRRSLREARPCPRAARPPSPDGREFPVDAKRHEDRAGLCSRSTPPHQLAARRILTPPTTTLPSTVPRRLLRASRPRLPGWGGRPRSRAAATIACAIGCFDA